MNFDGLSVGIKKRDCKNYNLQSLFCDVYYSMNKIPEISGEIVSE